MMEMKKLEINDKTNYEKNRVISGYAPHKILELCIKEALDENKDVFDIDNIKWKELDYSE